MTVDESPKDGALTMGEFNYATLKVDRIPIPNTLAQEFLDFMVSGKRWHENVNIVHRKVRELIQAVRAAKTAREQAANAPTWQETAFALRHPVTGEALSLRKIAERLDKPLTSVRRALSDLEAERGVAAGA